MHAGDRRERQRSGLAQARAGGDARRPLRASRSKLDFSPWADGQAWRFVKGEDYHSSTETFRYNIRRWAKANGYEVELRPYPTLDRDGNEIPLAKTDAMAVGVRLMRAGAGLAPGTRP